MLILLVATFPAKGGQRSEPPRGDATADTLRVDVNLVTIGVRVSDRKNREVSGLKQEEFSVFASGEELATVVRTIAQDLRTQYTLGYYTSPSDHGKQYHRIEVKVRPKGLTVRARHGFRSPEDEETEVPVSATPVRPAGAETIQQRSLSYEIKTEHRGEQVIFREDFSDAASGWPQKPGFFFKAGQYHLEQLVPKVLNEGHVAANGPWWTDFQASVVVEFQFGRRDISSMTPAASLVFRLNERGYYALVIS